MTLTLTPLARVALALALVTALAACGGSGDEPAATEATRRPLSTTAAAAVEASAGLPALQASRPRPTTPARAPCAT